MIKNLFLTIFCCLLLANDLFSFCGFFVAQSKVTITNKTSQVILVRDGDRTTITMSNDFKGDAKDFAMVIPVTEVLKEENIKVVNQSIFDALHAYSQPRLATYYDTNPCEVLKESFFSYSTSANQAKSVADNEESISEKVEEKVKIEATYTVGEYDIIILSSTESSALEKWLTTNGYKIPENAADVLEPYIKSDLKFFVVKVNLEKQAQSGFSTLRPIQMTFHSDRFMLPIRLGMANAEDYQDLVIYGFTKIGRIESTNYRTVKMPTNNKIPLFIENQFDAFYESTFTNQYKKQGKNALFLEYSWSLNSNNYVKCDPCASTPPNYSELVEAGIWWVQPQSGQNWGGSNYDANIHFTRLHVRYDRPHFPQDLMFQITPNTENFQVRYVTTHPATGDLGCDQGQKYLKELNNKRLSELAEMDILAGWSAANYKSYAGEFNTLIAGYTDEKTPPTVTKPIEPVIENEPVAPPKSDDKPKKDSPLTLNKEFIQKEDSVIDVVQTQNPETPIETVEDKNIIVFGGIFLLLMTVVGFFIYRNKK